jgi:two-component system nitrogen regulation response regulator NtrX
MTTALVVDDEKNIRETLKDVLEDEGYAVHLAENGHAAFELLDRHPVDVILLDLWLPEIGGMDVLKILKERYDHLPVIIISGHGNIDTAVKATKIGAFDFIEKPLSIERILNVIDHAVKMSDLRQENLELKKQQEKQYHMVLGRSEAYRRIESLIASCAKSNSRVFITGENGTGKEVVARRIHQLSGRSQEAFVAVNCAAIPQTLIESELFGYEKGAFTGAIRSKMGRFELAHGGTIFLDEIADMSLDAQAKVLRVLEEMQIERIGGVNSISINVRVMAASNRNVVEQIKRGRFREDLYYRLNVVPIHVPPLRERREDIGDLVTYYIEQFAHENNKKKKTMSDDALHFLVEEYAWPGNVRELKNLVERLTILTRSDTIGVVEVRENLPHSADDHVHLQMKSGAGASLRSAKKHFEKSYILNVLKENSYNVSKTARMLEIERSNLYKLMRRLGIDTRNPGAS